MYSALRWLKTAAADVGYACLGEVLWCWEGIVGCVAEFYSLSPNFLAKRSSMVRATFMEICCSTIESTSDSKAVSGCWVLESTELAGYFVHDRVVFYLSVEEVEVEV